MLEAIPYWLHLLAATVWVGSQLFMFLVLVPSLRSVNGSARTDLMARLTVRFGWLGGIALAVLVLTGIDNIDRYSPSIMFELRYGYILVLKVILVGIVVLLTAAHSLVVGPKLLLLRRQAAATNDEPPDLAGARQLSVALSSATLLLSLAVLFCAALLRGVFAQHLV